MRRPILKRGTPENPKVAHLSQLLNIPRPWAVGILEMLWHFTAKFAPCGDIGKYTDATIAEAVGWQRPTGERGVTPQWKLSDALVEAKWLDRCPCHRLVVHDWSHHADQSVTKYLDRHRLSFVHAVNSLPLPLPLPLPQSRPRASRSVASASPLLDGVSSASPVSGLVGAQAPEVSTGDHEAASRSVPLDGAAVETPTKIPKRKKPPGQTRVEYEVWQREQEQNGRLGK